MSTPQVRDTHAAYRDALIEEHASYVRAGRTAAAGHVAAVLLADYDYDVRPAAQTAQRPEPGIPETTAAARPPEAAVEPKAQAPQTKATQPRTAVKKAATSKPAAPKND